MHAKTMEGLVGARMNINLINTPMRVYNEAKRKGDTAKMERAMGYVNEFQNKAEQYKTKADKGMEEDAKEAKEKAHSEQEKVIKKRREEREEFEKRLENIKNKNQNTDLDTVELSQEGKVVLKENTESDGGTPSEAADTAKPEPVIYTKTGGASRDQSNPGISISVSV